MSDKATHRRIRCPVCDREVSLNPVGTLRLHEDKRRTTQDGLRRWAGRCKGSGWPMKAARA
jgi:hypothetical protein